MNKEVIDKVKEVFEGVDTMKIYISTQDKEVYDMSIHYGYNSFKREVLEKLGLSKEEVDKFITKAHKKREDRIKREEERKKQREESEERELYEKLKMKYEVKEK